MALRERVRMFMEDVVAPAEPDLGREDVHPKVRRAALFTLRSQAREAGQWLPHMDQKWGGMGLRQVELAVVQSEAAKTTYGPWVLNCQAPDEGNMHSLAHWGTENQQKHYLRPLCEGRTASCFAMTEPETAGSDPTLLKAWSPGRLTLEQIRDEATDNPMAAFPYTKRMCSNWFTDQAAAVPLCSTEFAQRLGIPQGRWVYPTDGRTSAEVDCVTLVHGTHGGLRGR